MNKALNKILLVLLSMVLCCSLFVACNEANIKVTFMVDGEVYRVQEYDLNEQITLPKDPTKEGYEFIGWYLDEDLTQAYAPDKVTDKLTLHAKFSQSTLYIIVNTNGGEAISKIAVMPNATYSVPDAVKEGYTFVNYTYDDENGEEQVFPQQGTYSSTDSMRIRANYTINTYTVTVHKNNGDDSEDIDVNYKNKVALTQPSKLGHTFNGWYTDENLTAEFDKETEITQNMSVYAKFTPNDYKITVNLAGGTYSDSSYATIDVVYGESYVINVPTKLGYTFTGFTVDGIAFATSGTYNRASNVNVTANYTQDKYTVTFKNVDGDAEIGTQSNVLYGGKVTAPTVTAGYKIKGVYTDSSKQTEFNLATGTITGNTTLYVELEPQTYIITVNNAQTGYVNPTVKYKGQYSIPTPNRGSGYEFVKFIDESGAEFAASGTYEFTKDITVTAIWNTIYYQISFMDGDNEITNIRIENLQGGTAINGITIPTVPEKAGYIATGWYTDKGCTTLFNKETAGNITNNIPLYAKYTANTYNIIINTQGGSFTDASSSNVSVTYNGTYTLTAPTRKGYIFDGYTLADGITKFELNGTYTTVGNTTVLATWKEDYKTVTYYVNGTKDSTVQVLNGFTVTKPSNPNKTGHTFKGWSTQQTTYTAFSFDTEITENTDLYAFFDVNVYTITVNNGYNDASTTVQVKYGEVPEITALEREFYTFVGFFTGKNGAGDKFDYTAIYTLTDDITIYGHWESQLDDSNELLQKENDYFKERESTDSEWSTFVYLIGNTYTFKDTTFEDVTNNNGYATIEQSTWDTKLTAVKAGEFTVKIGEKTRTIKIVEKILSFNAGEDYINTWVDRNTADWDNNNKNDVMNVGITNFIPDVVIKNYSGTSLNFETANLIIKAVKSDGTDVSDKITIHSSYTAFDFDSSLNGETLKLTISPKYAHLSNQSIVLTIKLNDGTNVYTDDELYTEYPKQEVGTINILRNITAVLHEGQYNVLKPDGTGYNQDKATYDKSDTEIITPKNDTKEDGKGGSAVYDRSYGDLTLNGNYYTVSGASLPLVDNRDGDREFNGVTYIVQNVQFSIFKFGERFNTGWANESADDTLKIENLNITGNFTGKSSDTSTGYKVDGKDVLKYSGSVLGIQVRGGSLNLDNVTVRNTTIGVTVNGANANDSNGTVKNSATLIAKDCIIEKSWANNIYTWGFGSVTLDSCYIGISCGAAVHFDVLPDYRNVDTEFTVLNNTVISNWVTGGEAWFNAYGMGNTAALLKTMVEASVNTASSSYYTIIKQSGNDQLINFAVLIKAGSGDNDAWIKYEEGNKGDNIGEPTVTVNGLNLLGDTTVTPEYVFFDTKDVNVEVDVGENKVTVSMSGANLIAGYISVMPKA